MMGVPIESSSPPTNQNHRKKMMDIGGYMIMLAEMKNKKIKLYGSPADRADLEIGDEILEVNGRSLENATHEEVIAHIHQCVKSRTINLRVKRRTIRDGGIDDLEKKRLQQAYVIAVEQQTRDKIAQIAADNNVEPVDLTTLNNSNHPVDFNNTHVELHTHSNGYDEPENSESYVEPPLTATSAKASNDGNSHDQLNQLFGEDFQAVNKPEGHDNLAFSLEFQSDISVPETESPHHETSPPVQEPLVQPKVLNGEEAPPLDLATLDVQSNVQSASLPTNRTWQKNTMPEPSAAVHVGSRPQREMGVDCPADFVAASGMKDPPVQSTASVKVNGHTLTNGTDLIPNSKQNNNLSYKQTGTSKYGVTIQQNSSQNNSQGSISFEPVSDSPLFEDAGTSRQYSTPGQPPTKKILNLQDLFATLAIAQSKLGSPQDREDLNFIQQFFHNSDVQHAVGIQHTVGELQLSKSPPLPVAANSETLAVEIAYSARGSKGEADELRRLLSNPLLRGLLRAHDNVANPDPGELPNDVYHDIELPDDAEDSVKIVRIEKTGEPLGATILNENECIIIGRIIKGGMAEKSGLLHEGDEILQINNDIVTGKSVNELSDLMANQTGTMTFLIVPSQADVAHPPTANTVLMHMRANFDYDPEDDMYIPCRELGLSFIKGDILHIINADDSNWWQAFREGDEDQSLAGLVPSKAFQNQREAMKEPSNDDEDQKPQKASLLCSCRGKNNKKKKKKKNMYNNDRNDIDEPLTYEEVGMYQPEPHRKRPIVLIGPPHVGRQELKQRLLESDRRFKAAVPHTTRVMKEHEINGVDYHFISKTRFEQDVAANKFVEYGDYEGNLYGTSLDSIQAVIDESKICLLNLHAQALKMLKKSCLKPYFIFICPPSIDRLRQQRTEAGQLLKEQELREIIDTGRGMEDMYGHYFDHVIIHHDHDRAYNDLISEIDRIQIQPQWVPLHWLS
ncbi:protein PALS1-like [Lytechinus pictus]|uniref:protein PALS1-like n=1 Tax=Lytechinus pictus TaxID=7653 RepID=UPI0030BA09C7